MPTTLTVPTRFNGPPASANGGWFSGALASLLPSPTGEQGAVRVRLSAPPPLGRPLTVDRDEDGPAPNSLRVTDGDVLVATAERVAGDGPTGALVAPIPFADADALGETYEGRADHPFATCFTCGLAHPDGLRLRSARVPGDDNGAYAAAWRATEVDPEILWAALDCPGGWASGIAGRPMVLGTMTGVVSGRPEPGEECVVMAWPRGGSGRRYESGTSAYGSDGRLLGRADATWIAIDPAAFRPR